MASDWEDELAFAREKNQRAMLQGGLKDAFLERTGEHERQFMALMAWWLNDSREDFEAYFEEVEQRFYTDLLIRFPNANRQAVPMATQVHLLIAMLYKRSMMHMANQVVHDSAAMGQVEMARKLHRMLVDSVAEVHQHACRLWNTAYDMLPVQGQVPDHLKIPDAGHVTDFGVEQP